MEILTKGEYAYRRLHDDILNGKLPGGSRLIVKELAEEYQISSMPIRNAITRLEELGLVRTSAHQGAWVAEMNLRDYFTFMLLRIEAEAIAATFAAQRCDAATIEQLTSLHHKMEATISSKSYESYGRSNRKFHNMVCEASGNPALVEQVNQLMNRTQLAVSLFNIDPNSRKESCREHGALIQALEARDPARSAAIIRYQRCRANLALLHAIQTHSPAVESNHVLKAAAENGTGLQCVEEFLPVFEAIREKNAF